MTEVTDKNPAEVAAEKAIDSLLNSLQEKQSFLLEAGAGAGKTYSLIVALKYLIENQGNDLIKDSKRIACITYTNVACEEIKSRIDGHPAVFVSTIHSFCWSLIRDFQSNLWNELSQISIWKELLSEANVCNRKSIDYDTGYRRIYENKISIAHDDVISLTAMLMENNKFRKILNSRYPIIFIDEYQDTNKEFIDSIINNIIENDDDKSIIGFFGDVWQKIYGDGCGSISSRNLKYINTHANFRSAKAIVDVLNQLRPDLKQVVSDPNSIGEVNVFHTNAWEGERQRGGHWSGDLPPEVAKNSLENIRCLLINTGWDFDPEKTKVLMLTNNVLAKEQGYSNIANVFNRSEDYLKQEDPYVHFFVNLLEPLSNAFENKLYGDMFKILDKRTPAINTFEDKERWNQAMSRLIQLRLESTIGEVIDHLKDTKLPRLPMTIENIEQDLIRYRPGGAEEELPFMERLKKLKKVPYLEIIKLTQYIDKKTPFSTKHGVKGAEFENVLVVFGRGWNHYNFNQFLEYSSATSGIPSGRQLHYERNRNLFYVALSRPMKRLTLLFTQELSDTALETLTNWVGKDNVISVGHEI